MRTFTLSIKKLTGAVFFLFSFLLAGTVIGQGSHTVIIDDPSPVAGEYQVLIGNFGPVFCEADDITGELIVIEDLGGLTTACDSVVNDLTGKIAIIDRGSCDFSSKVYEAQKKGAIAVLVCNNVDESAFTSMGAGGNAELVTIPSFFMLKSDCDVIRAEIVNGVTITIDRNDLQDDFEGEEIYREEFANGLGDWTARVVTCADGSPSGELWRFDANGEGVDPCAGPVAIVSPSSCNGAMVFESGFADNGDVCPTTTPGGNGTCPSPHVGELISPEIDLTGSNASGYSLRFYQITAQFLSTYWVGWSYDGGTSWDSVQVNTEVGVNEFDNEPVIKVPLVGSQDASSVMVKFRYEADYYLWLIDDVQIISQEANNLQVKSNFYAIPPNASTPLSQAEPFGFLADIENIGASEQSNVNLNVTVVDTNFNIVYSDDLSYGAVPPNTLVENVPFNNTFTPAQQGEFLGIYDISSDFPDADSSNNFQFFFFEVSDTTFSKEFGPTRVIGPAQAEWDENEPHSWAYGNYYYVKNGQGNYVRSVTFGLGNPSEVANRGLLVTLYKWAEDTNNDGNADANERTPVGFTFYSVTGNEAPGAPITIPFPTPGEDALELEDETPYLIMLEYLTNDAVNLDLVASEDLDYGASILVSQQLGAPRYAGMLGINGDLTTEPYSSLGFGTDLVPMVRLNVGANPATSTKELVSIENEFAVYPNPATAVLNVQLALQESASTAQLRIFDISGRTLLQRKYDSVQLESFQYPVNHLAAGTYFLQVITENGTGTKKFIVTK